MFQRTRWLAEKLLRRMATDLPTRSLEEWEKKHEADVREAVARVLPHLPDDGVFLDVGANVGIFSRLVREARPRATGHLFEPVAEYARKCRERFADDPRIEVHAIALGNEDATRPIYKAAHNYGANSLVTEIMFDRRPNSAVRPDTVIEEEQITLRHASRWLEEHGIEHVDLIKTDTEGYDYAVLDGLREWLERTGCRPALHVELLAEDYHPLAEAQRSALDALEALGYERVDLAQALEWTVGDVLLLPRREPDGARGSGDEPAR